MNSVYLFIALGPLSIYLLLIGRINLATRPFLTTGTRDTMALALATGGLAAVGPIELFMPEPAAAYLGPWIWLPLLALYGFSALLIALLMKPRIVAYNITIEQLRPLIEQEASKLDPERRWAGSSLVLPNQGIQLTLECLPTMQNVQLIASGSGPQNLSGWRRLELALKRSLESVQVKPNPRGLSFLLFGIIMAAMILFSLNQRPQDLAQAVRQFLRL